MAGQHSILLFWQTTQQLLLQASAFNNGQATDGFDHDAWTKRYEDILIRLKRLAANTPDTQQRQMPFTEQDTEALEQRLSDIRQHLHIAAETTEATETVSDLAHTLSGVQVGNPIPAASGLAQEVRPETGRPTVSSPPTPSRGFNQGVLQDFILESLSFTSMAFREQDIEEAHGTSFDWIFHDQAGDSHPSFFKWLTTAELGNIYWITGKPGSGKSTLIRYLAGHRRTRRMLQTWAGISPVTIAGFYFWTSGSQEQRSQTGLLRSLLFQLLSTKPDLIATALPHLWQKLAAMTSKERVATKIEWSVSELMEGFSTFLQHGLSASTNTKLCLFVDGLDEFEGDHEAIIHFFRGLAEGKHGAQIKLCLSSRPWPVFARAFEYAVPNLKLQASNLQDMMRYAIDKLSSSNDNMRSAVMQEVEIARKLVHAIVELAGGVFLWVRLVVGELIQRFDHPGAKMADMCQYVCALPAELESLFEVLVFHNQSRDKQAETSRLFQLVRARETVADFLQDDSAMSLSLWELAFAINGGGDDLAALERAVQQEPETRASRRCADTRFWALNRSVGLLEVHHRIGHGSRRRGSELEELAQNRVTYLHRTVRDWLILSPEDQVWHRLQVAGDVSETDVFDPHLRLLQSYLLQMKHPLEEPEHHRRLDEWYPGIALALTHARHVERDPHQLQARLVGEVEKTISWYWDSRGRPEMTDHWARNSFGTYEERRGNQLIMAHAYLALCTKFGLQQYVIDALDQMALDLPNTDADDDADDVDDLRAAKSESDQPPLIEETPLLHRALEFLCSRQKTIYPLSSLSFVRALLDASEKYASSHPKLAVLIGGVNAPSWSSPLLKKKQVTTWVMVLRHLRDAKRRGWIQRFDVDPSGTERWTAIVECLVQEGGADREAVVLQDGWDPEASAEGVLGRGGLLDEYADFWVEERLVPLFGEDGSGAVAAQSEVLALPVGKQSRLDHIFTAPN
ncbi:small s protein [Apiospora saccharicola]